VAAGQRGFGRLALSASRDGLAHLAAHTSGVVEVAAAVRTSGVAEAGAAEAFAAEAFAVGTPVAVGTEEVHHLAAELGDIAFAAAALVVGTCPALARIDVAAARHPWVRWQDEDIVLVEFLAALERQQLGDMLVVHLRIVSVDIHSFTKNP
jgi:hypothetical protein